MSSFMVFFVLFSVFSYTCTSPVREKRFIPKININFEAGKTLPKPEQPRTEVNGTVTHTKVINAPFGLGALTITSSHSKPPGHGGCEEKPDEANKKEAGNEEQENNAPTEGKKPHPISGLLGKIPFLNRKPHGCKKENSVSTTTKPEPVTDKSSTKLEFDRTTENVLTSTTENVLSSTTENVLTSTTENVEDLLGNVFGNSGGNGNGGVQTNLPNGSDGSEINFPNESKGLQTDLINGSSGYQTNLSNGNNGDQISLMVSSTLRPTINLNDRAQTGEGKIDQRIFVR